MTLTIEGGFYKCLYSSPDNESPAQLPAKPIKAGSPFSVNSISMKNDQK